MYVAQRLTLVKWTKTELENPEPLLQTNLESLSIRGQARSRDKLF